MQASKFVVLNRKLASQKLFDSFLLYLQKHGFDNLPIKEVLCSGLNSLYVGGFFNLAKTKWLMYIIIKAEW